MTEKDFLNQVKHDITKSARYFKDVASIMRQRRACPSRQMYEAGIRCIDGALLSIQKRIDEDKS